MANTHDTLFAPNGALASALKGYHPRAGQLALSQAIDENFKTNGVLLAEAGTGTGKTFAYLLPALASADKVLISTATKNLQEQIFIHDLPIAKKALQSPAKSGTA
ncbi:DEAD/DEAH box helicase [Rappaport israeli]|uniref:DEAD/DEAH box helicase n=1 Tax=Rappaport israeli TaxID=1839807 RepID=UPI0009316E0C|nr:DEAD/DEAH box helicase [Rappaport israeli]